MTDKQIIIDCSYKGECQMMGCINDDTCFIKQLFEERDRAEKELYSKEQECEELKETIDGLLKIQYALADRCTKYSQTLTEIKEIAKPHQKEIKEICGNCNNYDDCHACCKFDLNCYQYKKGDTTACEKFIVSWKYDKNELANKILQKINECEGDNEV